jgi:geranylgeranyl diphosphate synthase, type II
LQEVPVADDGAQLLSDTVGALSERAPAVVAAAAAEMRGVVLALRFGDGSSASLQARHSRLVVTLGAPAVSDVEAWFDDRAMNVLFDLQHEAVDHVLPDSLDVRGGRSEVLAVWRAFQLLSQRGSGLRSVQQLWRSYRQRAPHLWGSSHPGPASGQVGTGPHASPRALRPDSGWSALDYLATRAPEEATRDAQHGDATAVRIGGTVIDPPRSLWNGRESTHWWQEVSVRDADLVEIMDICRARVSEEVVRLIPDRAPRRDFYDLLRDYPGRRGKGLRPTLCIAACGALGGRPVDAIRTAAAMELFHNGFLVHDDIADESTHRRGAPTLHMNHGVGLAVNAGDGLNLLAVDAVLSNLESLGLGRTLGLIHEVLHMCRETIEGQAVELGWIRRRTVPTRNTAYYEMSTKKTGWYTCITPCRAGAVCAGVTSPKVLDAFVATFRLVGIAFQIQDDVLNLIGEEALYGKEPLGDLLEGKRTVMLMHLFRTAPPAEREVLRANLMRPRPEKTQADAVDILASMRRHGSIDHAIGLADRLASQGVKRFEQDLAFIPENEHKAILRQITHYVTTRPL